MKTVVGMIEKEIIVKNSRFIGILYHVNDRDEVKHYLEEVKKRYRNATHYCYAYIIDDYRKFSDDGEPGGTAGNPILQVLEKNDLNMVLACVVRYFGGIKLGSGGLVGSYTRSITNLLDSRNIRDMIEGYNIDIVFDYSDSNRINYLLRNIDVLNKDFNDKVIYNVNVKKDDLKLLENNNWEIIKKKRVYVIVDKKLNNDI